MKPEDAIIEARAKIIWGDPTESVSEFLQTNGFSEKETLDLLADFKHERATAIRSSGIKKLVIGSLLAPIPLIAYLVFMTIGYIYIKIFALTCLAGLFGLWKIIDGLTMIMNPRSERGDLSNLSE